MDPESPIIILSDIHLGSDMARADALSHFLETAEFGTLILNGDVLDNPNMRFLTPSHWKLLDRIKKIAASGKKVIWISGNHDFFARHFFKTMGLEVYTQLSFMWRGKRCLVFHGHQYDKFLVRNEMFAQTINRSYRLIQKFDGKKRRMSGFVKKRYKVWLRVSKWVAKGALKHANQKGAEYVFCGHTHELLTLKQGKATYMNSGSWVDDHCSYILLKDDIPKVEVIKVQ